MQVWPHMQIHVVLYNVGGLSKHDLSHALVS